MTHKSCKGAFKYYVIMFLTFLGPPTYLFDDFQYLKIIKNCHFLTPLTHLFDDVILEWSLRQRPPVCIVIGQKLFKMHHVVNSAQWM